MSVTEGSGSVIRITKLNRTNYHQWKFQIKLLMSGQGLFKYCAINGIRALAVRPADLNVGADVTQSQGDARIEAQDKFDQKDYKAQAYIATNVEDSLMVHLTQCTSAKAMWDSLQQQFEKPSLAQQISLTRDLYHCELRAGDDCVEHINSMQKMGDELAGIGAGESELKMGMLLLMSLPKEYSPLVTALSTLSADELTWTNVRERVIAEDTRLHSSKHSVRTDEKALMASSGGNTRRGARHKSGSKPRFDGNCANCKKSRSQVDRLLHST